MLSFHQVCASYGKNQVLDHIDFSLVPHKLTAVVGRNGSGKSTLVSCVNQELPYTGEITFSLNINAVFSSLQFFRIFDNIIRTFLACFSSIGNGNSWITGRTTVDSRTSI